MTAIAALTINNGAATPVAKTFNPVSNRDGIARWAERSSGISLGFPTLSFSLREPKPGSRSYKLVAKVVLPVLDLTIPSSPTKAYDCLATVEMVMPEKSTLADRNDLLAYVKNYLANATVVTAAVQNFEQVL